MSDFPLAERLYAGILARDRAAVEACIAPSARFWSNLGAEQDRDAWVSLCDVLLERVPDVSYDEIRRRATPDGWVQQHVLRGTSPAGTPFAVQACLLVTVADERIARVEEYLDSAQVTGIGL